MIFAERLCICLNKQVTLIITIGDWSSSGQSRSTTSYRNCHLWCDVSDVMCTSDLMWVMWCDWSKSGQSRWTTSYRNCPMVMWCDVMWCDRCDMIDVVCCDDVWCVQVKILCAQVKTRIMTQPYYPKLVILSSTTLASTPQLLWQIEKEGERVDNHPSPR